jgi:hypothetical protein
MSREINFDFKTECFPNILLGSFGSKVYYIGEITTQILKTLLINLKIGGEILHKLFCLLMLMCNLLEILIYQNELKCNAGF